MNTSSRGLISVTREETNDSVPIPTDNTQENCEAVADLGTSIWDKADADLYALFQEGIGERWRMRHANSTADNVHHHGRSKHPYQKVLQNKLDLFLRLALIPELIEPPLCLNVLPLLLCFHVLLEPCPRCRCELEINGDSSHCVTDVDS